MTIQRFENIEAWKEARQLVVMIYDAAGALKDYALRDQINRSSMSVMANIAEGFSSQSNKLFVKYLYVSLASASETQSHLYVLLDRKHIPPKTFEALYAQCTKTIQMIRGFIRYLKGF